MYAYTVENTVQFTAKYPPPFTIPGDSQLRFQSNIQKRSDLVVGVDLLPLRLESFDQGVLLLTGQRAPEGSATW